MVSDRKLEEGDENQPLTDDTLVSPISPRSRTSSPKANELSSTASSSSLFFDHIPTYSQKGHFEPYRDHDHDDHERISKIDFEELDIEEGHLQAVKGIDPKYKKWLYVLGTICLSGWVAALVLFVFTGSYKHRSSLAHNPEATASYSAGKQISIPQLQRGEWIPESQAISWIRVPNGDDGMLLKKAEGEYDGDYLTVEDVRSLSKHHENDTTTLTLMKRASFRVGRQNIVPDNVWPSPDLKKVLCLSERKKNWRHSFTGKYWIFDVDSQSGQPLDPQNPDSRMQLATWSPKSDSIVFTRENNMFLRHLSGNSEKVTEITTDGGEEMFNGVPDWVYEEEVFSGNKATWWSNDGKYIAFLATDERGVPEYPVQYFIARPSGEEPEEGLENYPETRKIKYPKAGTTNPVVHLRFYDMEKEEVVKIKIPEDFADDDRIITEVIWGDGGNALIRETDRESDVMKMVLVDVPNRSSKVVRTEDIQELDGGWFEISETTTYVPKDASNGRKQDGYIDTVIHEGYNHLGYFSPLDNPKPRLLTSGQWEVVQAPSAVDLENNLVYFIATKESSISRHIYSVNLHGKHLTSLGNASEQSYYSASFSKGAGYVLLSYQGPNIPNQKILSTPSNKDTGSSFSHTLEDNKALAKLASEYELPLKKYSTINVDGFDLNVLERLPPHFDKSKRYPVLFYLYGGPGSQTVNKRFTVDFQSYVASTLGYIVVTVDNRGTGFIGRKARCIIRDNIGYYEAHDQIAAAKEWAKRSYVDSTRIAIWGWSYGGYMTLKTLEQDAGQTFKYGMAVAPVTDWSFYDTIYTERWMHTPQHNPSGYKNSSIHNVTALSQNVRWLIMHGTGDDNVHIQNSLTLLDQLDLARVENYDIHVFPDSDHGIYFHGANRVVYERLSWWLVNAFNGEWERIENPVPLRPGVQVGAPT